jgi:hypothetical protein
MKHCKSCRRDLETSAYNDNQKTCAECLNKRKRHTIEECREFAKTKGGLCLSDNYVNANTKMNWQCGKEHRWQTAFNCIKNNGRWCAECAGRKKLTIEDCSEFAKSKDGLCLSPEYEGNKTQMSWQCGEKHQWITTFHNIKNQGTWCAICAGTKKHSIEECREFAKSKGGLCLSTEYEDNKTQMSWQCGEKHQWQTTFHHIKNGTWCPNCASHKSEKLCREIFEDLLLEPFLTKRPKWLEGLELDGYNKDLNIAFEYNGKQHYEFIKHFHNNIEKFEQQKNRDKKKYAICQKRDLNLILVPYQYDYRNPEEMRNFIFNELWKIS